MRADVYLYTNGLSESRSRAAASINAGCLFVNGRNVTKCSFDIAEGDTVELKGEAIPYVGRGGFKLEGAIESFGIDPEGFVCVDVGASTGGFTDVLLKHGAAKVYAVDCGRGQLHPSLVNDQRVVNLEGFNARELCEDTIGEKCDIAVMDVSFISQTLLHYALGRVMKDGALYVTLIKPQFEVGKENIGKGGIVKSKQAKRNAVSSVVQSASRSGFGLCGLIPSPIRGGDGNEEYLAVFRYGADPKITVTAELLARLIP